MMIKCQTYTRYWVPIISIILFIQIFPIFATEESVEPSVSDVEDISLETLLNQEVIVASKKVQKVEEAPAIISILTKKEMMERGYLSLYDALNSLPGVNSVETYFGYNQVFFRGMYSALYNDKTLVLINGHPYWDSIQGSHYIEAFPIEAVKQLEVVRGPGSTLYGTNAFAGVINIVTENGQELKGNASGFFRLGSYSTFEAGLTSGNIKDDLSWMFNVSWRNSNGYPVDNPADELGNPFHLDAELNYKSIYGQFAYKNLKMSTYSFIQEKTKIDVIPIHFGEHENTSNNVSGSMWMVDYKIPLHSKGEIQFRGSYNYFDKDFNFLYMGNLPQPNLKLLPSPSALFAIAPTKVISKGHRFDVETNVSYVMSNAFEIIAGAGYEEWSADTPVFSNKITGQVLQYMVDANATDRSMFGYAQGTWSIGNRIQTIFGARYVYNKDFGSYLNPRGGIVVNMSRGLYLKGLFGSAFRAPTMNEKFLNFGVATGNRDLDPEKLQSIELGLDYVLKKVNLRINFYHTLVEDLIEREPIPDSSGKTRYTNLNGTSKYTGIESEIRVILSQNLNFYVNAFLGKGSDVNGNTIQYIPSFIQNGGVVFKTHGLLTSVCYSYVNGVENNYRPFLESLLNPGIGFKKAKISGSFVLNGKIRLLLKKQIAVALIIHNILDHQVMAPEFVRQFVPELQNGPGRMIYIELRKAF